MRNKWVSSESTSCTWSISIITLRYISLFSSLAIKTYGYVLTNLKKRPATHKVSVINIDEGTVWKSGGNNKCNHVIDVTFRLLYDMLRFSTSIFYRGVPGFAIDRPCSVWWRGLTICLLYVELHFGNLLWHDNGFVSLTWWRTIFHCIDFVSTYILMPHNIILHLHLPYSHVSSSTLFFTYTLVLFFYTDVVLTLSIEVFWYLSDKIHIH